MISKNPNAYLQRAFRERNDERLAQLRRLPDTRSRLIHLLSQLVEGVQRQKQIFEAYMLYRMKQVVAFRPVEGEQGDPSNLARAIIALGQENHELRSDLPVELLEDLFVFTLMEAIKPLYLQPENYDPRGWIERCVDLFLHGAKA